MKKALLPVITFAKIDVKRLFRDKVGIFFVFIFPLLFLIVFGSIFRGGDDMTFRVALLNRSDAEFANTFVDEAKKNKVLKVDEEVTTLEQAQEKMSRGQLEATIVLPEDFGQINPDKNYPTGQAEVIYDRSNEQAGQTLASIMDSIFREINQRIVPADTPFTVKAESTAQEGLSRFDYTFSGLLGFTLLSLGIFGPTTVFPRLKEKKVLRRYHTTTLKVWQYFTGNVISNGTIGLMAAALMIVVASTPYFGLSMKGSYFMLASVVLAGVIMLFGIGLAIGGWAKNENQAAPLAQIVTLPMMFLSGVFFPTFLMPELLQNITRFIPLTSVVDAIRLVITEGAGYADLWQQFAIIGGWTVVVYVIAFRVFRWE